jgi:hypothetical protein
MPYICKLYEFEPSDLVLDIASSRFIPLLQSCLRSDYSQGCLHRLSGDAGDEKGQQDGGERGEGLHVASGGEEAGGGAGGDTGEWAGGERRRCK